MAKVIRIAIVGDVHGQWDAALDGKALQHLKPAFVLFAGDFGGGLPLIHEVSKLDMPKAVILGNHDGSLRGKKLLSDRLSFVNETLAMLGDSHVGYKRRDFSEHKLSVIGARPFSRGGNHIHKKDLVEALYSIKNMEASAAKIIELSLAAPKDHSLIFLGHNGPSGLGSQPHDICGKDFEFKGGDHGDPDFEAALKACIAANYKVPLVVFGHMHKNLCLHPGERKMCVVQNGTVYVNSAVVPRVTDAGRNFTAVDLSLDGQTVLRVAETWVSAKGVTKDRVLYLMQPKQLENKTSSSSFRSRLWP